MIHAGTIALIIALLLIGDRLPGWLLWIVAIGFSYGLIFWT